MLSSVSFGGGLGRFSGRSQPSRCRLRTYSFHSAFARIPMNRTYSHPGRNDRHQSAKSLIASTPHVCGYGQCFSASSPAVAAVTPAAAAIRTFIHAATVMRVSHTRALSFLSQAKAFASQRKSLLGGSDGFSA